MYSFVTVELLPKQLLVKDVTTTTLSVIWGAAECEGVTYFLSVIPERGGTYPVQVGLVYIHTPLTHTSTYQMFPMTVTDYLSADWTLP